jgi:hypothetical protein
MFEDGIANSLSDDKVSNRLIDSRTKVVRKRSVSDDSDKQNLELSQSHSDESWWSRAKRSFTNFFWKPEEKVVAKREAESDSNASQVTSTEFSPIVSVTRRKRQFDEEDDDEDNEIDASGDDPLPSPDETTTSEDPIEFFANVKDDKYCKILSKLMKYRSKVMKNSPQSALKSPSRSSGMMTSRTSRVECLGIWRIRLKKESNKSTETRPTKKRPFWRELLKFGEMIFNFLIFL